MRIRSWECKKGKSTGEGQSVEGLAQTYTVVRGFVFFTDLSGCHWLLVLLAEQLDRLRIVPKVLLTPYENYWYPPAEMVDFTDPLDEGNCISLGHFGVRSKIPSPLRFRESQGDRWHSI